MGIYLLIAFLALLLIIALARVTVSFSEMSGQALENQANTAEDFCERYNPWRDELDTRMSERANPCAVSSDHPGNHRANDEVDAAAAGAPLAPARARSPEIERHASA